MTVCLSLIFISHVFTYYDFDKNFISTYPDIARQIIIGSTVVRVVDFLLQLYVAFFVVLLNFRFYLSKRIEKQRPVSLEEVIHIDGGDYKLYKFCNSFKLLKSKKEKVAVCYLVSQQVT